jgi:hypothetical protein
MNKKFEQWNKDYLKENGFLAPPFTIYEYLQANPHLLKEDGDEQRLIGYFPHHPKDKPKKLKIVGCAFR